MLFGYFFNCDIFFEFQIKDWFPKMFDKRVFQFRKYNNMSLYSTRNIAQKRKFVWPLLI